MGSFLGTILVTGCSGLVGTYLTHGLIRRGYRVIGISF
jgi:nucleoside-diphosphate-sugar epimerase